MVRWLLNGVLRRFGRRYRYDTDYLQRLVAADPSAGLKVALAQAMFQHRRHIPPPVYYAAKLRATLAEDCGPCVQLVVDMALEEGVAADVLEALVRGDLAGLDPDTALAARYADQALRRENVGELAAAIEQRWGREALPSLALALAAGRFYPTLKYALGAGQACGRVTVQGRQVARGSGLGSDVAGVRA